jgi:hypothetical protein
MGGGSPLTLAASSTRAALRGGFLVAGLHGGQVGPVPACKRTRAKVQGALRDALPLDFSTRLVTVVPAMFQGNSARRRYESPVQAG